MLVCTRETKRASQRQIKKIIKKKKENAEDRKTPLLPFITFSYMPGFRRKIQIDNSKPLPEKKRAISPNFHYLFIGK